MTKPRILVTGGAGYIGSHMCKMLDASGYHPVVYDNFSTGHRWAVKWGTLEEGDMRDGVRVAEVIERHDPVAVMHFAAFIAAGESVEKPDMYFDNNVGGTQGLLAGMAKAGARPLVFSSTAAVYDSSGLGKIDETRALRPDNPYGETKVASEKLISEFVVEHGSCAVALRYFNAAGADPDGELGEAHDPETHLTPLVLEAAAGKRPHISIFGDDYLTPDGTCVRDYIHICDLADAHLKALEFMVAGRGARFEAFNLGNGEGFSVREVIEAARRVTGRDIPERIARRRPGDPPVLVADSTKAKGALGWTPQFAALEAQIEHAWNWALYGKE